MYTGKLMFRKLSCGCVIECFAYPLSGYDRDSMHRFIICSSCIKSEASQSEEEIESKEKDLFDGILKTELQDPGTTDDEWFLGNLGTLRFM